MNENGKGWKQQPHPFIRVLLRFRCDFFLPPCHFNLIPLCVRVFISDGRWHRGFFGPSNWLYGANFSINSHESRSLANTFGAHVATLRYNNDEFKRSGCAGYRRFNSDPRTRAPISLAIPFFIFCLLREPGAAECLCATTKLNVIYHIAFGAYSLHFIGFSYEGWE